MDAPPRSTQLTQEEHKAFYEKGLLPAILDIAPADATEWLPTYDAEMFRARGKGGELSFTSKILASYHVSELGDALREALDSNGCTWAQDFVFLHEIRGVKKANEHDLYVDEAPTSMLDVFLKDNSLPRHTVLVQRGQWWTDVGLQIFSDRTDEVSVVWRTDSHGALVQAVTRITEDNARRVTSPGSSKYTRDPSSHLVQASGFRLEPGERGQGPHKIAYIQAYTTEKAPTARKDRGNHAKFITCEEVFQRKHPTYLDDLLKAYSAAAKNNSAQARLEVRVPIQFATAVLTQERLTSELIMGSLLLFSTKEWW